MSYIKTVFTACLIALLVGACATVDQLASLPGAPGYITEERSEFDGARELYMEPAWTEGDVKLSLRWRSTMDDGTAVMVATVKGAYNIIDGQSLKFNVDGRVISLHAIDSVTEIRTTTAGSYAGPTNWSSREYFVTREIIDRLVDGNHVVARVDMMHGYAEGIFSGDLLTMARPAFRAFYRMAWGSPRTSSKTKAL